jgi:aryl carrier-like protein
MLANIHNEPKVQMQQTSTLAEVQEKLRASLINSGQLKEDAIEVLPATPLQEGMVAEMISSGYQKYFNHELFRLRSDTDPKRLSAAWQQVIKEHAILRTRFVEVEDPELDIGYAQVVHPLEEASSLRTSPRPREVDDLHSAVQEGIRDAIVTAKQTGDLLQFRRLEFDGASYDLLSISHALYDGWSLQALHEDVQKAYNGLAIQRPAVTPILEELFAANGPEAASFWRTSLAGLPQCTFPTRNNPSDISHKHEQASKMSLADLTAFCKAQNISLGTLGRTTYSLVLASFLKQLDVAFGVVLSCRDSEEAERVMFPTMNTVVVRAVLHGSVEEMLVYMQQNGDKMREFQHYPLRKAQGMSGREGPLFDTLFIYQGKRKDEISGMTLYEPVEGAGRSEVEFMVAVEMEVVGEDVVWRVACRNEARSEQETRELVELLDQVLERIVRDPAAQVIASQAGKLSICGLPSFESPETSTNAVTSKQPNGLPKPNETWSEREKTIRSVLAQISKIAETDIAKDHTIFHLGLDSISAIKVSSLLRRQGLHIGVNDILKHNTVRKMAEIVLERPAADTVPEIDVKAVIAKALDGVTGKDNLDYGHLDPAHDVETIMPLTAGQLYMYCMWEASEGAQFAAKFSYEVAGKVDRDRLSAAWETLRGRHPILRTVVVWDEKTGPLQAVLRRDCNPVTYGQAASQKLGKSHLVELQVAEEEARTVITLHIHHILYDAVSLPLIQSELDALYHDISAPAVSTSNLEAFVAYNLQEDLVKKREAFWKGYLPAAFDQPSNRGLVVSRQRVEVFAPSVPVGNIKATARKTGVSIDALVLTAFAKTYHSLPSPTNTPDPVIGLYLSNRSAFPELNLSHLAAPTLNLLPLYVANAADDVVENAKTVQRDLRRISERAAVGASLADVWTWTGQTVGVFVNLLKDGTGLEDGAGVVKKDGLFARSLSVEEMLRPRAKVVDVVGDGDVEEVVGLRDEAAKRAYIVSLSAMSRGKSIANMLSQPCIDVELRVSHDGTALDIGIFAPENMLTLDEAKAMVERLGEELRGLIEL